MLRAGKLARKMHGPDAHATRGTMSIEIKMPQLSVEATEGLVVAWHAQVGQAVEAGQILVEVETDKVILELEAARAGVLAVQAAEVAQYVRSEGLLAVLAEPGEDIERVQRHYTGRTGGQVHAESPLDLLCPLGDEYGEVVHAIPLRGTRGLIAARMTRSIRDFPQYQVTMDCAAEAIQELRKGLRRSQETRGISLNAIVLKCVAKALKQHPIVNSTIVNGTIYQLAKANIACAVALPEGVTSPVIRDVGNKTAAAVSLELETYIGLARSHKLKPEHLHGGTFTVSSLGSFGIRDFVAIVVPPQVAILSVGSVTSEPVVRDEKVVVGKIMALTLSCDHRAVDGAMAAEFLKTLHDIIENPASALE